MALLSLYEMTGNPFLALPRSRKAREELESELLRQVPREAFAEPPALPGNQNMTGFVTPNVFQEPRLPRAVRATRLPAPAPRVSATPTATPSPAQTLSVASASPEAVGGEPSTSVSRRAALERALEAASAPPDYERLRSQQQERRMGTEDTMYASILAGLGPSAVRGMQEPLLKQALAASQPLKIEGGQITPEGEVMLDPAFQQQRKIEALQRQLTSLDALEERARSNAEKAEIARERNQIMLMIAGMRAGADGAGEGFKTQPQQIGQDKDGNPIYFDQRRNQALVMGPGGQMVPFMGGPQEIFNKTPPPSSVTNKIAGLSQQAETLSRLSGTYQDRFSASYPGTGQIERLASRYGPGVSPDMHNWWANYNEWANKTRHELFGSALTRTEAAAFAQQNINENDKPATVRARLGQQQYMVEQARQKLERFYRRYPQGDPNNPTQVGEFLQLEGGEQAPQPGQVGGRPGAAPGVQMPSQSAIEAEMRRRGLK